MFKKVFIFVMVCNIINLQAMKRCMRMLPAVACIAQSNSIYSYNQTPGYRHFETIRQPSFSLNSYSYLEKIDCGCGDKLRIPNTTSVLDFLLQAGIASRYENYFDDLRNKGVAIGIITSFRETPIKMNCCGYFDTPKALQCHFFLGQNKCPQCKQELFNVGIIALFYDGLGDVVVIQRTKREFNFII